MADKSNHIYFIYSSVQTILRCVTWVENKFTYKLLLVI